jgi:hypothetical protein
MSTNIKQNYDWSDELAEKLAKQIANSVEESLLEWIHDVSVLREGTDGAAMVIALQRHPDLYKEVKNPTPELVALYKVMYEL